MISILFFASQAALAWECIPNSTCGCHWAGGNDLTYKINTSEFTVAGATAIRKAGNAWRAGPSRDLRGAEWEFIRGSDISSDGAVGDFTNQIYKKPNSWFIGRGVGGAVALVAPTNFFCGRNDADMVFNSSKTYTTAFPSENTLNQNLPTVAIHEFGHMLGLDHSDPNPTLSMMLELGPLADIAEGKYRINEDDYLGLVAAKPHSATGKNLMLQRFRFLAGGPWGEEVWEANNGTSSGSDGCPGSTLPAGDGPADINAVIIGTASSVTAKINWWLSADDDCEGGIRYNLGTRSPTMSSNQPYEIGPNLNYFIPSGVPAGGYYLCAMIDPYDVISETNEGDNSIMSDTPFFEVLSCP